MNNRCKDCKYPDHTCTLCKLNEQYSNYMEKLGMEERDIKEKNTDLTGVCVTGYISCGCEDFYNKKGFLGRLKSTLKGIYYATREYIDNIKDEIMYP